MATITSINRGTVAGDGTGEVLYDAFGKVNANDTALNNQLIASISFDTNNGVLTLTKEDASTFSVDLDGRYLQSETSHADVLVDGDFTSQGIMLRGATSGSYSILTDNSANWNTAFSWGDHALAGYQVGTPTLQEVLTAGNSATSDITTSGKIEQVEGTTTVRADASDAYGDFGIIDSGSNVAQMYMRNGGGGDYRWQVSASGEVIHTNYSSAGVGWREMTTSGSLNNVWRWSSNNSSAVQLHFDTTDVASTSAGTWDFAGNDIITTGYIGVGDPLYGESTPQYALHIEGTSTQAAPTGSDSPASTIALMGGGTASGDGGQIVFGAFSDQFASIKGWITDASNSGKGQLRFYTRAATTDANMTLKASMDSNGWDFQDSVITTTNHVQIGAIPNRIYSNRSGSSQILIGDWWEILEITPTANSSNHALIGDITFQSSQNLTHVQFKFAVRGNTLPALAFSLKYSVINADEESGDGTWDLVYWYNATTGTAKLLLKNISAGTIQNCNAMFKALLRGNYTNDLIVTNGTTEHTAVESGYAETSGTRMLYVDENAKLWLPGALDVATDAIVDGNVYAQNTTLTDDNQFYMGAASATNPAIFWATSGGNDYTDFVRSSNTYRWQIGGTTEMSLNSTSLSINGFTLDGNTITGIDDSGEFTNDDSHIMTSAAVEDKILGYGYYSGNIYSTTLQVGYSSTTAFIDFNSTAMDFEWSSAPEFRMTSTGNFHADADITAYSSTTTSDRRYKKDIEVIPNALGKINTLNGVTFKWKRDDKKSAGLIAQDVEKVLPQAVCVKEALKTGEEYLALNYDCVVGMLVEAVKELTARVEELENGEH